MNPNYLKTLQAYQKSAEQGAERIRQIREATPKVDPIAELLKKITLIKGDVGERGG